MLNVKSIKELNWRNATRVTVRRGTAYRDNSKLYEIEFRWDQFKGRSGEGLFAKFIWNNMACELPLPQKNQVVYIDTKDVVRVCASIGLKYGESFAADTHEGFEVITWNKAIRNNETLKKRFLGIISLDDLLTEKKPDVISVKKKIAVKEPAKEPVNEPQKVDWTKFAGMFGKKDSEVVNENNEEKKEEVIVVKKSQPKIQETIEVKPSEPIVKEEMEKEEEPKTGAIDWTKFAGSFSFK